MPSYVKGSAEGFAKTLKDYSAKYAHKYEYSPGFQGIQVIPERSFIFRPDGKGGYTREKREKTQESLKALWEREMERAREYTARFEKEYEEVKARSEEYRKRAEEAALYDAVEGGAPSKEAEAKGAKVSVREIIEDYYEEMGEWPAEIFLDKQDWFEASAGKPTGSHFVAEKTQWYDAFLEERTWVCRL